MNLYEGYLSSLTNLYGLMLYKCVFFALWELKRTCHDLLVNKDVEQCLLSNNHPHFDSTRELMATQQPYARNYFVVLISHFWDIPNVIYCQRKCTLNTTRTHYWVMIVIAWHERGFCSPSNKYNMWRNIFK